MKFKKSEKVFTVSSGRVSLSVESGDGQRGFHVLDIGDVVYDPDVDFNDTDLGSGTSLKSNGTAVHVISTIAMLNPSTTKASITYTLADNNNEAQWVAEIEGVTETHAVLEMKIEFA